MSKNIVVITSMYPEGQQAPGQEYCINTWKYFL